jgi:Fic family protein
VSNEEVMQPLTPEEIAQLDAAYVPFPAFEDWPADSDNLPGWIESCEQFKQLAVEATAPVLGRAREIAIRAAAFDTGAIEGLYATNRGLTFTVAEQAVAWEQEVDAQGPDARALFEAQLRAFELVLDYVTDSLPKVTQAWVRRIHEETTAAQETYVVHTAVGTQKQPLPRGDYKSHPNHVRTMNGGVHAYAPVDRTQSEMQRLVSELESSGFRNAPPIIQASYAHYALVAVHPFADGNGRVARALASAFTYREASVPLLILAEHRDAYFEALADADRGKPQEFVDLIAKVARDGVELARDSLQTALAPQPEEILRQFDELQRVDKRSQERNEIAVEIGKWVAGLVAGQLDRLGTAASVNLTLNRLGATKTVPPKGFRKIPRQGTKSIRITATSLKPKKVTTSRQIDLFVSDDPQAAGMLAMKVGQRQNEVVVLDLDDLWPTPSSLAQHQVENFIRRTLGHGLKELQNRAGNSKARS